MVDSINGIKLLVQDTDGYTQIITRVKIYNDSSVIDTLILNMSGVFRFPDVEHVNTLEVSLVGYKKVKCNVTPGQNYFEVLLAPDNQKMYYIFQTDERWKIKNDRLYYPGYRKDNRLIKHRVTLDYFVRE